MAKIAQAIQGAVRETVPGRIDVKSGWLTVRQTVNPTLLPNPHHLTVHRTVNLTLQTNPTI
ncbi:hypothetical protein [Cohnella cellulosilytica]|uniref:hypothetical protein n=1 Tax=Cohnella cellulosilytica TaxID=986710 RepID=UPI00360AD916